MLRGKKSVVLYGAAGAVFVLVLTWWLIYFARQGDLLVERLEDANANLTAEQSQAVRDAADSSLRMFAFEGAFLALIALGGLLLLLRSMRRDLEYHRRQRDFLSAITHELRSPIAAARLQVESLQLGRVPERKVDAYLQRTLADLDRLARTVDQLLTAARASSGRVQLALEPIDLAEFTERTIKRLRGVAAPDAAIEIGATEPVRVQADPEALDTILENLVSNALKYGGDPPRVEVRVESQDGEGVLVVSDQGPGLKDRDSARVFDPFVRGGADIVARRPGVGLGLYLVSELTRALGGKVSATNAARGGLDVRVGLPLHTGALEGGVG